MSKDQAMTQKTRYVIDKNTLQMETFKDLFILQSFHCFSLILSKFRIWIRMHMHKNHNMYLIQ